jgi:hypothetical protein
MKIYNFLTVAIAIIFSGCDKTTGGYYCIKNDTQYDIKVEHVERIGAGVVHNEFNIAPSQVYKAFWGSPDFETFPSSLDTFYITANNIIYMDTYDLSTSLTHMYNYVYDKTSETKNASYSIFYINENYISSLIEVK